MSDRAQDTVRPKPKHLGPAYAAQFSDQSVVDSYHLRPPYPPETFAILRQLIADRPRVILDVGCGTGEIARTLAPWADRVDAVDASRPMIVRGRSLPDGDHPNLRWIHGAVETVELSPPYALITAGASLHWMAWDVALPRFRDLLTPGGVLAIVEQEQQPNPWDAPLQRVIDRYSTNRDYQRHDLVAELTRRDLFQQRGEHRTAPVPFTQSVADYVESFHARNGFSRDRMTPEQAAAFDAAARAVVAPHSVAGQITLHIVGVVTWGRPTVTGGSYRRA